MPKYLRTDESPNMSSLQGYISIAPAKTVQLFGAPEECDGFKVSGEYVFKREDGLMFIVYDWKCTSLYNHTYPSPEEFWASEGTWMFHVGADGKTGVEEFINDLQESINKEITNQTFKALPTN